MADTKISALTALTGANSAPGDLLDIVDVSDTSMAATGTNKSITREGLQTFGLGTITTDQKVQDLSVTWNNAAVTFTGLKFNVTDSASNAASLLMDLQVGGTSKVSILKSGAVRTVNNGEGFTINVPAQPVVGIGRNGTVGGLSLYGSGVSDSSSALINSDGLNLPGTSAFGFSNGSVTQAVDVKLNRDAAGSLALRNSTNAQTFNIYNTYTDASNYERGFMKWNSNVLEIGAEAAGTGTLRSIYIGTTTGGTIDIRTGGTINMYSAYTPYVYYKSTGGTIQAAFGPSAANVLRFTDQYSSGSAAEFLEMTAPAAPSTNGVRIYAEDNGSGKTRLMALFATGAAQQLAIEP